MSWRSRSQHSRDLDHWGWSWGFSAFAVGAVYGSYADAFAAAAAVWLVGIAIGMGLFGMGEIIRLLQEMNRKMDEEKEKP